MISFHQKLPNIIRPRGYIIDFRSCELSLCGYGLVSVMRELELLCSLQLVRQRSYRNMHVVNVPRVFMETESDAIM